MEKVAYPISARYRPEWGDWEAVREIVQNAIDENANASMHFKDGILTVRDEGIGFEMKHLLLGETSKNGSSSIGKFGEGLKFALLALIRSGKTATIRSNLLKIEPGISAMFGEQVLTIYYNLEDHFHPGTEVKVTGLSESFEDRFLSLDLKECMSKKILLDRPGEIYIKGIFLEEMECISGYNLIIERENPISGEVNLEKIFISIKNFILKTDDKEYMIKLLKSLQDPDLNPEFLEYRCGSRLWFGRLEHEDLWKEAVEEVFGPKVCYWTDKDLSAAAEYKGYLVIPGWANFITAVVMSDREVLKTDKVEILKTYEVCDLSSPEQETYSQALDTLNEGFFNMMRSFEIVDFVDENVYGVSIYNRYAKIARKTLKSFEDALMTMVHEYVHYSRGYGDLTQEFFDVQSRGYVRMILKEKSKRI